MVTRTLLTATAAGLSMGLLAQTATGAEGPVRHKAPVATEFKVDTQTFRNEIDAYVREVNEQLRETLNRDLRRDLTLKLVLANNELRARG